MKLEKVLLVFSSKMSKHAWFCLLTLLMLLGLLLGLWQVQPAPIIKDAGTRGVGVGLGLCPHASVAFSPSLAVDGLSRLLRAEDAHILYGPDEFGEYQLRVSSSTPVSQAMAALKARVEVISITEHSQCE